MSEAKKEIAISKATQKMQQALESLHKDFSGHLKDYMESLKKLDPYRGVTCTDENLPIINEILIEIQDKFQPVYVWLHYNMANSKNFETITNDYFDLMNQLK